MLVREGSFDKSTMEKFFNYSYNNIVEMVKEDTYPREHGFVAGIVMEQALNKFMRQALEWRFQN
jgi:hypothetical protein